MITLCALNLQQISYYFDNPPAIYYIKDLQCQAPALIKEALKLQSAKRKEPEYKGFKVYGGGTKRKSEKVRWIQHKTNGVAAPKTIEIIFSNGTRIVDYSIFDPKSYKVKTTDEMKELVEILNSYNNPLGGCQIIKNMLHPVIGNIPYYLSQVEEDNYRIMVEALKGGANCTLKKFADFETHIDYHQLYASVMITHSFPYLLPEVKDGYYSHPYAIYVIAGGKAKLKKDGFALLPYKVGSVFGANGEWCDLVDLISICTPDLYLLFKNYEVEGLTVSRTIYYPHTFDGSKYFIDTVNEIYEGRQKNTGSAKRFYKLLNEYLAGYFERSVFKDSPGWWNTLECPKEITNNKIYNPIVGIFITAYGRQQLDALLHMFPKDKVIGYDTDCVFFHGKPEEVPVEVLKKLGHGIGELHFDGVYKDVVHEKSKFYYGFDIEANEPFQKMAGVSKTGMIWRWNKQLKEYELKKQNVECLPEDFKYHEAR